MATKGCAAKPPKLKKIGTDAILDQLKAEGDNSEFFYLYISTADKERKKRQSNNLQQPNLPPSHTVEAADEDSSDAESENDEQMEVDKVDTTENVAQQTPFLGGDNAVVVDNPPPPLSKDKARSEVMNKVHKVVLPKVLTEDGWKKVYDKDMKLTYRALYFNCIPKDLDEDDDAYIRRVGKVRKTLAEEVDKVKEDYNVDFKINSLLSKPFIYDEPTLAERSVSEGRITQRPRKRDN